MNFINLRLNHCKICGDISFNPFSLIGLNRNFFSLTDEEFASMVLSNPHYFKCMDLGFTEINDLWCIT